ncbi:type II toxin-antitoxin system RelE/ParE family toxin [Salinispirillum marinum]|uniref:Type II toxin-antitoxin system RelE/ParE family toxin n=2 Tax=Saccharospirillaceae TaxID=255527 RepID=A0ABV8BBA4_9GAMM
MIVRISKDAAEELAEAAVWYENESTGLGERLIDAFEHATELLKEPNPPLTLLQGKASRLGAKSLILHRFPFSLVTIQKELTITVVAFAHHSRKPGYWHKRIVS